MIDLRSDTVTKPTPEMREAMLNAEVGDDVYIEDPTVNRLEEVAAEITGHEASLFFPTGSMANQAAIHIHTSPGEEVICEDQGHIYNYEMATMAAFSGVLARPVIGEDGFLSMAQVRDNIRPGIYYRAQTGLVSLENTHNLRGGRIHDQKKVLEIIELCHEHEIPVHMDDARIFNASVASGKTVEELASPLDSVMFCLSKGLGAPVGSMLCGNKAFIERARAVRKLFGGGMRQVGILAAAGLYALQHNVDRLAEDHAKAQKLARALSRLPYVSIDLEHIDTNIIVFNVDPSVMNAFEFAEKLKKEGIICGPFSNTTVRMVTHLDVDDDAIETVVDVLSSKVMEQ